VCNISGYGPEGAYRDKKAYDLLIQSEAGFLSVTGTADTPSKAGISVADIAAGMYAYTNILAALIERGRTGSGQQIHVSMLEALAEWMGFPMYYSFEGAEPPIRAGASHATIYPYGPFRVGDGGVVMLGLQNEREWETFCTQVLRQPDLASDRRFDRNPKRHERREEVTQIIEQVFSSLRSDEVVARLEEAQIANARVNNMADLWAHPQLQARNRWTQVSTERGPIPALIPPGLNADDQPIMNPIPALGQHTDAILEQLGYTQSARAAMRERGVI
jgi:crotonobetainyl-CoA:carnitine CoA-transferase CaiB-like acyl-CoA transferase